MQKYNIWEDINKLNENRVEANALPIIYKSEEEALSGEVSGFYESLNGVWKFKMSDLRHMQKDVLSSDFDDIDVPSCWQLQGHDNPLYVNREYEFTINPPYIPSDTLVGIYKTKFIYKKDIKRDTHIYFDGVCSGFSLYVNDKYVGYSQGSHMTSEFDITDFIIDGENDILVYVYKFTDGSYLETQDKWRLSGIFRDVYLQSLPKSNISDVCIKSTADGNLEYSIISSKNISCRVKLLYENEIIFETDKHCGKKTINDVKTWNCETPHLYHFVISVIDKNEVVGVYCINIGFRTIEIKNKQFYINGVSVKLKGMNRHDFDAVTGYYVTKESMENDIILMKKHSINMIRCAHYPNSPQFYDLCDKYGMYVMSEADIETHGMQLIPYHYSWLSDDPKWENAYLDRADRMVKRDINHACIVIWSLGNESGFGQNHVAMSKQIRSTDNTRPLHYMHAGYDECVDIVSKMYPWIEGLKEYAKSKDERPFFMNEFGHAMGNGPGSLKEYWDIVEEYPRVIGGAIWEWCDQGIWKDDHYTYGGDYGEEVHDKNLCIDGMVTPDRKVKPALLEYSKVIQPIKFKWSNNKLQVYNKHDFTCLSEFDFIWKLYNNEVKIADGKFNLNTKPHSHSIKSLPIEIGENGEWFLNIYAITKKCSIWANVGHIIAKEQFDLTGGISKSIYMTSHEKIKANEDDEYINIEGAEFSVTYNKYKNAFENYIYMGEQIFKNSNMFNVWRAPTDNDIAIPNPEHKSMLFTWKTMGLDRLYTDVRNVTIEVKDNDVKIVAQTIYGAMGVKYLCMLESTYTVYGNGDIQIDNKFIPNNIDMPKDAFRSVGRNLPRLGIQLEMDKSFKDVMWFGKGPHENYCDRMESAFIGKYEMKVKDMSINYIMPQENGNRSQVRYAALQNGNDVKVTAECGNNFDMSVSEYTTKMLEKSMHTNELKKSESIIWNIDYKNSGLGSNACGPMPLDKYLIRADEKIEYTFYLHLEK